MPPAAIAIGGGALLGGVAGAISKTNTQEESSSVNAGTANSNETAGSNGMMSAYGQLQGMVNTGPGQDAVTNASNSATNYAQMLQQYANGGYMPTGSDVSSANNLAQSLFAPQQTALNQSFQQQTWAANRQAAAMGRAIDDPILQAKLGTNLMNQQAQLSSQQGAFASQYAQQMPQLRLGYMGDANNVLSGLATQAMSNRQALAAMGQGIMNNERNFRLSTATHYGTQSQTSGGGWGGALNGMIGGAGMGMSAAGGMSSLFSGGATQPSGMFGGITSQGAGNIGSTNNGFGSGAMGNYSYRGMGT